MLVFLSYKSEDSALVRPVAERLIGCGLDVWFNEYQILIGQYDQFQQGLDDGLRQATHAVVFTNDRWARADWCTYEMRALLDHIDDRSCIVEVAIPHEQQPRAVFPELLGRPPILFRGDAKRPRLDDVETLAIAILDRFGLRTDMSPLPVAQPNTAWLPSYGVTFDPGIFTVWSERTRAQWVARLNQSDLTLGLRTVVYHLVGAKTEISMDVYALNYESVIRGFSISDSGDSDDRAVYTAYRKYAQRWFGEDHGHFQRILHHPKGLHLVFVDGTSHIAVTYVSQMEKPGNTLTRWERRYAIRIPSPLADAEGELSFVFSVGLTGDQTQQLRAFCRLAPLFDTIVASTRVRWPSSLQAFSIRVPAYLAKIWTAGFIAAGWWNVYSTGGGIARLSFTAVFVGIAAGDLLRYLCSSSYRAVIDSLRPALVDVRPVGGFGRYFGDTIFQTIVVPYHLSGLLVRGIVVAATFAVFWLPVPLFAAWAAMYSQRAVMAPPSWLAAGAKELLAGAAALFGFAASQFAIRLAKARYLKPRSTRDTGGE